MKYAILPIVAFILISCSVTTPEDEVKKFRTLYKIDKIDFTVSDVSGEVTYEVKVQNNSGGDNLHELTCIVEAMDEDQKTFWSKKVELEVGGLGNYGTRDFQFKDEVPGAEKIAYFNVTPAPHDKDSDYKTYREFKRVVK